MIKKVNDLMHFRAGPVGRCVKRLRSGNLVGCTNSNSKHVLEGLTQFGKWQSFSALEALILKDAARFQPWQRNLMNDWAREEGAVESLLAHA